MRGPGPRLRIRRLWTHLTAEFPPSVFYYPCGGHDEQSYGVSDREYFPYRVSLPSSGKARVGRRRRGGSLGPRS
ncbi:hypothetical protein Taro_040600 [Colocasia esculenta]|uniref:Uncharacterized protein n=1 Tax=Colocasia esculenta TaxID=4460 RepID=A0A843WJG2_COLES|nr:hypothetical protein [Colocasia esculenta]